MKGSARFLARHWRWWAGALAVCLLGAGAYGFVTKRGEAQPGAAKPGQTLQSRSTPVVAMPAKTSDVGVYLVGLGSVTPLNTVTLKSRVDGQLMKVLFREGQAVRAGDLLAEIDPRPFQVQVDQAEGQLARDQALLKNAQLDLERYRVLVEQDSIPKQQLDAQASVTRCARGGDLEYLVIIVVGVLLSDGAPGAPVLPGEVDVSRSPGSWRAGLTCLGGA